jgi:hypothetical protein
MHGQDMMYAEYLADKRMTATKTTTPVPMGSILLRSVRLQRLITWNFAHASSRGTQ